MALSQHEDRYVWTWEPAAGSVTGLILLATFSLQVGRSLALRLTGAGWRWPHNTDLFTSSWSILRGNTLAGLEGAPAADPGYLMWIMTAVIFSAAIGAAGWVSVRHLAGARHRGMATAGEANRLLGTARLRSHRAVIRPDLYAKQRR